MSLPIDKALRKAQSHLKVGETTEAKELYKQVLSNFPKNKKAIQGYQKLKSGISFIGSSTTAPPQEQLQELINLHNQGQFEKVLSKVKPLVSLFPRAINLFNIQGASNAALQRYDAAIDSYKQAIKIKPDYAEAYLNMGIALKDCGDLEKAMNQYKKALRIKPDYFEAYLGLGVTLKSMGNLDASIESYKKAIKIKPDYAEAYSNMGNALRDKGEIEAAIDSYKQAIKIKPLYAETYINMGVALQDMGDLRTAINTYQQALQIQPGYAEGHNNMGNALKDKGNLEAALDSYRQAINIKPDYAEAYINMGNALKYKGNLDLAIASYKQALNIQPNHADAHYSMGNALKDKGSLDLAIGSYNKSINCKPDHQLARVNKLYLQARICDWTAIEQDGEAIPTLGTSTQYVTPFAILGLEDAPERHRLRSEIYTIIKYPQKPLPPAHRPPQKPTRLRIGYFSADFKKHPVAYLMAKVIETHDRGCLEVYGYSIGLAEDDEMRQRLIKGFDVFKDVEDMSDQEIALLVRKDNIDIAIDLTGYTENSRPGIFAYRAAPIQISYLGYPGTMGADFVDYIIADQNLIPIASQKYYVEKPIYLPFHYQAQDDNLLISDNTPSRPELGLPENGFVFCAINNTYKITPSEFNIWMRLLQQVKGSVLWLLESNKWVKNNLRNEAGKRGVNYDRLVFSQGVPHEEYLAQFRQADLYLDTFTYNAGATASNALWAGLPVLTKLGTGYTSRMAGSLLASVGLPELITTTEREYEELALKLATNPERLAAIKRKLACNRSSKPLFDTELFTKHLEDGYQQAYQLHFEGENPENIYVKAQPKSLA